MKASRSDKWCQIRAIEDVLALVANAKDLNAAIRAQAWRGGDWTAVFVMATTQDETLEKLKAILSTRWIKLMEDLE